LLSVTAECALTVGARRDWRRHLFCPSPGAGMTLPTRAPRDHERHRHDDRSGCAARGGTRRRRTDPAPAPPPGHGPHRHETWAAMAYLVVIGSVVVFLLYLVVLRYWAASRASYGFVIIPFVTVVLSAWLDNEPIGVGLVLGGLLVLAGVYIGALRPAGAHSAAVNAKTDTGPSTAAS